MNGKLLGLTQRRGELLARIAVQREEMTEIEAEWNAPLALAGQGVTVVRFLRHHHLLVAGAIAFVVIRRHSVAALLWGMWNVWKGYRDFASIPEKS